MAHLDRTRLGIIVACTVGNIVSMTPIVHATFGTFLLPLSEAFGWSRASISGVLGVLAILGAIVMPLVGLVVDRYGARRIVLTGNLLLAAGMALLGLSNGSLTQFYLTFALIAVAASLCSTTVYSKTVSDWFSENRGTMLGVSAGFGNGVGATVMPIVAALMLHAFGWRGAFVGLGLVVVLLGFPTLYGFLRDAPRYTAAAGHTLPPTEGLTLSEAARTTHFWLILVAIASGAGCLTAVFGHVVPILAERRIDLGLATAVLSVFAAVCAAWQIGCGVLLDRFSTPKIAVPMYLASVGGLALLEYGKGTPLLLMGGGLLGIGLGTQFGALPFFIARYFGLRSFGTILGVMFSAAITLQGSVPILLDHIFDLQGTYSQGLAIVGACLTFGAGLLFLLPFYRNVESELSAVPETATGGA
jgi:MFS family permease